MTDPADSPDLTALLGSRICHDLISPLGAIGNGVELLMMTSATPAPEVALIADSVTNANARIRFFRVAFGATGSGQHIGLPEIQSILSEMTKGARLTIDWTAPGSQPRPDVKLAFLAIQCLEMAMPYGGRIAVAKPDGRWEIEGQAARTRHDPALWNLLTGARPGPDLAASAVQFALLPEEATKQGRPLAVSLAEGALSIGF